MIVSVRDITARCGSCGGADFKPAFNPSRSAPIRLATRMSCAGCGQDTTYRALLESIGEEAMRRANEALEKLKKRPQRRPRRK